MCTMTDVWEFYGQQLSNDKTVLSSHYTSTFQGWLFERLGPMCFLKIFLIYSGFCLVLTV